MNLKNVFGPLDRKYCGFFYLLSLSGILLGIWVIILCIIYPFLLNQSKYLVYLIFICFLIYFQNRLLYNMCQNQKIKSWITQSRQEGFSRRSRRPKPKPKPIVSNNCNCATNKNMFNFGQFNLKQRDILKLVQTQLQKSQPQDVITREHAPRIQAETCDKPITCPKCNETPYCTSNGWTCDTMDVESTDNSCIQ
jgi:hypothetical protein